MGSGNPRCELANIKVTFELLEDNVISKIYYHCDLLDVSFKKKILLMKLLDL